MKLKDLKNEFGKKIAEARKINEKVAAEKRDLTAKELETYDKLTAEIFEVHDKIQDEKEIEAGFLNKGKNRERELELLELNIY